MAYKIVIDAGHGGDDPGAVYQGRREKDDNLRLAQAVGEILADNGIDVEYTRTSDVYQTPFQKATIGNQSGADYFISFHRNSSPVANQYSGVETLVYNKSGIKYEMAENIDGALAELGFKNLGVKERPGLVVLRRTAMPSLLIEAGFLNNDQDNRMFDERFDEIAQAIANAILGTLDMETVEDPAPEVPGNPNNPGSPNPPGDSDAPQTYYRVQVGAYRNREYADNLVYELDDKGFPAYILYEDGLYKVQVGAFLNIGNAIRMEQRLRQSGYSTWITT